MVTTPATDWKSLRLHHWSMLSLLHGAGPPAPTDGTLPTLDVDTRLARVSELLGISADQPDVWVNGPGGTGRFAINNRLVDKMRDETYATRTPFIPWASYAIINAIEVWRRVVASTGEFGPELRTFFLAPLAYAEENECYLTIAGADAVVFNVMRCDSTYANGLRIGDLLYARDPGPCGTLCCKRYVELRRDFVKARASVLELQQRNQKLRRLLKRKSG